MSQGIITRQSIQNTIALYVGVVLGFFLIIILYPRILTPTQFGLTRVLLSLGLICAQLGHFGTTKAIIRYFPYFNESKQSRSRFLTASLLVSVGGFILFVILYLLLKNQFVASFQDKSSLFEDYYLFLIPIVFGYIFFQVLDHYNRALRDSVTGTLVNATVLRVLVIGSLIVFYFGLVSFTTFMYLFIVCYMAGALIMMAVLYKRGQLSFAYPVLQKSRSFLKELAAYNIYSLLGGLSTMIMGNIDIIMLGAILNLKSTAIYTIAFNVCAIIIVPQRSILKIVSPILADLLKDDKLDKIQSLYKRTSLNQIIAGTLIYIGIWANINNLLYLLPPQYRGIKWLIVIIGFSRLINMATGINGAIIANSKYFRFSFYINFFLVVIAVVANYLLIPIYGLLGAAIATAGSVLIYNIIKTVFVWFKFSMQPFQKETSVVIIIAAICLVLSFQIPYLHNFFVDVIVRSVAITVVFIGSILLFHLSDDVENLLKDGLRRVKGFLHS